MALPGTVLTYKNRKRIRPVQFYKVLHTVVNKLQASGIHCDRKAFYFVNTELLHLKVNLYGIEV